MPKTYREPNTKRIRDGRTVEFENTLALSEHANRKRRHILGVDGLEPVSSTRIDGLAHVNTRHLERHVKMRTHRTVLEGPFGFHAGERKSAGSVKGKVGDERAVAHDELGLIAAWFPSEINMHADMSVARVTYVGRCGRVSLRITWTRATDVPGRRTRW